VPSEVNSCSPFPWGLVRDALDRVHKDPNQEIQDRLDLIFTTFLRLRSASKVLGFLNARDPGIPRRDRFGDIIWKKPTDAAIVQILKNPAYAGAFVYGRTRAVRKDPTSPRARQVRLSVKEWKFRVNDVYPAYISWEMFERIQAILLDNYAEYDRNKTRGVPRPGGALLHGMVYCGECGHKLVVQYKGGTRYLCNSLPRNPEAAIRKPRPPRPSKLDPFKEQIRKWVMEDHCTNCEVIFVRLQKLGYTGGISILKEYVHPLRPVVAGHVPVQRYETKPGEQVQFDWGEFVYEHEGKPHKFYGFTAILGYSPMRFVTFVKRCDTTTLIRCLMEAFEYFGGLTKTALTDRMKSVLLEMEKNKPRWNPRFADFMVSIGVTARVCKPYRCCWRIRFSCSEFCVL
jgi:transposase